MSKEVLKKQIRYKKLWFAIKKRWYVVMASVLAALVLAFIVNRYKVPQYRVSATVFVKNLQPPVSDPANLLFSEGMAYSKFANTIDQSFMLRSFPMVASAIEKLDFSISYYDDQMLNQLKVFNQFGNGEVNAFLSGMLSQIELYNQSPIKLLIDPKSANVPFDEELHLILRDITQYSMTINGKTSHHAFGEAVNLDGFQFVVNLVYPDKVQQHANMVIKINRYEDLVFYYRENLQVQPIINESSILKVSIVGENSEKEIDFINQLTETVIEQDLAEKNYNAEKTVEFINQQLAVNTDSLQIVEGELQRFKQENSSVELSKKGEQLFGNIQELEKEKADLMLSNQYFDYLLSSLQQSENVEQLPVPASVGIDDPILNQLISQLVTMHLETKMLRLKLNTNNRTNPMLLEKEAALEELKRNIFTNVHNQKTTNEIAINDLERRIKQFSFSLQRLPGAERKLVNIQRNYTLNENLYMLLMEKKLEASITAASNVSDYKVVESAMIDGPPVGISKILIYLSLLVVGIGAPLSFFYLQILLNNKIQSKQDIELYTDKPILGSIVHADQESLQNQHSLLYECFRHIRANLIYLTPKRDTKVIVVTSSESGEGKSFCTWHLARVLAMSFKKTIIIDTDMRKQARENQNKEEGLSEFLAGMVSDEKIINGTDNEFLNHIKAGKIPPNPGELILSEKMTVLLENLKQNYEYIIIDTPPVGIVADSMALLKGADVIFCITRANFTNADQFNFTIQRLMDNQANQLNILFNDTETSNLSNYGNYYYIKNGKQETEKKRNEEQKI